MTNKRRATLVTQLVNGVVNPDGTVNRDWRRTQAAYEFIAWLTQPDKIVMRNEIFTTYPTRASAARLGEELGVFAHPVQKGAFDDMAAGTLTFPMSPMTGTILSRFSRALREIDQGAPVRDTLEQAARDLQFEYERVVLPHLYR
jgi:ABC-type glycerol-3-phosphate transport system substrate-binding protein